MVRPGLFMATAAATTLAGMLALECTAQQGEGALINQRPGLLAAQPGVGLGRPAPAWKNGTWLNTPDGRSLTLEGLRGRVVLLNFWTYKCWNCTGALPSMVAYDSAYRERGLTLVGIHSPEFPPYAGEHNPKNVQAALRKYGLGYANALDNDHATWDLYNIRYWPSYVLIDRRGVVRYEGYGEFHVGDQWHRLWDQRIRTLVDE